MVGVEARRTPSHPSMGTPRYGGCVGAFLHFFDWNPGKRFYSTKRLPASKPEEGIRRCRSFRSEHGSTARTRLMCRGDDSTISEGSSAASGLFRALGDDHGSLRARPGVVARLMGLESPSPGSEGPSHPPSRHRRCPSSSGAELPFVSCPPHDDGLDDRDNNKPTALLEDLLQRDVKASKRTLRDRMPWFAKRAQEQVHAKKGTALKALLCRQEDSCDSSPCMAIMIPEDGKQSSFLSRLAPAATSSSSTPRTSSSIPLHLRARSPSAVTSIDGIIAGWPLAGKECTRDVAAVALHSDRSALLESESSSSRPKPKPVLANVARKIFHGKRRGAGSEDSESNESSLAEESDWGPSPKPRVGTREFALKKAVRSLTPPRRRNTRLNTNADRHHHHHEEASVRALNTSTEMAVIIPNAAPIIRTSSTEEVILSTSKDVVDIGETNLREPLIQSSSRSTDFPVGEPEAAPAPATIPSLTISAASHESTTSTAESQSANPPIAVASKGKPPPLDGYRAPKARCGPKVGLPNRNLLRGYGITSKLRLGARKEADKAVVRKAADGIQPVRENLLANNTTTPLDDRLKPDIEMAVTPSSNAAASVPDQAVVANSADDNGCVVSISISKTDTAMSTQFSSAVSGCDETVQPTETVFHVDLQELFAVGPDELSCCEDDDEIVEAQRTVSNSPLSHGRCREGNCSGPSVSSVSVVSDVNEERNGDAWSSCASYNPADCNSSRTLELPDTDADESDLREAKPAPVCATKISEEDDTEAGQPSPVSILNSPFHDEAGTASECTRHSDEDGFPKSATADYPHDDNNDKIRQALLDISMFQSLEVFTFDYKERSNGRSNNNILGGIDEEQAFVREILTAANFMSISSPNWFDHDVVAIDPSLFDKLESGDMEMTFQMTGGLQWRCDRKLLFDCVNEALAFTLRRWCHCLRRPRGQRLVEEVYTKIEAWRKVASSTDFLIEGIDCGTWRTFSAEVAEVGVDIESMVWKAIVEDVVMDIMLSKRY